MMFHVEQLYKPTKKRSVKKLKATWVKTDGTETEVTPKNGTDFQLDELQEFIQHEEEGVKHNTIGLVSLPSGRYMVINDDGRPLRLDHNEKAEEVWSWEYPEGEYSNNDGIIVGNVLICDREMIK